MKGLRAETSVLDGGDLAPAGVGGTDTGNQRNWTAEIRSFQAMAAWNRKSCKLDFGDLVAAVVGGAELQKLRKAVRQNVPTTCRAEA